MTMMKAEVSRGTVRHPDGPERFARIEGLGRFALTPDDPRLAGAVWNAYNWTTIEIDRDEALVLIREETARVEAALDRDRVHADRQLAAMNRQAADR